MGRRIFVGDVQGCRHEFERLLEEVAFDPAQDELHPVGDFVNRGPDSVGVLRLCARLGAGGVLGNHDLHLLHAAAGTRTPRPGDTLAEVLAAEDRETLVGWLAARPFVRVFEDVILIHAGMHPGWEDPAAALAGKDPLAPDEDVRFAVGARYCDPEGRLAERDDVAPPPPFAPWFDFYDSARHGGRTVVFGHWSRRGLVVAPHLRGLDTGCVWGGELTAWIAEEDRLVRVPATRVWASYDVG